MVALTLDIDLALLMSGFWMVNYKRERLTRSGRLLRTMVNAAMMATNVVQTDVRYDWPTSLLLGIAYTTGCTSPEEFCKSSANFIILQTSLWLAFLPNAPH